MIMPLAWATACGMGTGPAPINSKGSVGRIAESGVVVGGVIESFMIEGDESVSDCAEISNAFGGPGPDSEVSVIAGLYALCLRRATRCAYPGTGCAPLWAASTGTSGVLNRHPLPASTGSWA